MPLTLLALGILIGAAGLAAIGFGIPINDLPLGSSLIVGGAAGFVGGLILIGLSAVVTGLARIEEALRVRPAARPETAEVIAPPLGAPAPVIAVAPPAAAAPPASRPIPRAPAPPPPKSEVPPPPRVELPPPRPETPRPETSPRPETPPRPAAPAPAGPSAVEVSAAAIERLRSSIPRAERPRAEAAIVAEVDEVPLSPNGVAGQAPSPRPPASEPAPDIRATPEDRGSDAVGGDAAKGSRLDFLFRSRSTRPAPRVGNFERFWPTDGPAPTSRETESQPSPQVAPASERAPQPSAPAAPPAAGQRRRAEPEPAEPRSVAILKSGVVDGMAYTLYADGSIEAKLPQGTVRFGSIAELRAHIESNSS
jgi:hypothetical protein